MTSKLILADPPWRYGHSRSTSRSIEAHYPSMPTRDIMALPIAALGDEASVLLLWATMPKLKDALAVMESWGFDYTTGAAWDKGILGMGYWFRGQHELLLVGTRKRTKPPQPSARRSSVFSERRTRHSKKPLMVYEWIEATWPDTPKVELFCRYPRPGWDVWGNEVDSTVTP